MNGDDFGPAIVAAAVMLLLAGTLIGALVVGLLWWLL